MSYMELEVHRADSVPRCETISSRLTWECVDAPKVVEFSTTSIFFPDSLVFHFNSRTITSRDWSLRGLPKLSERGTGYGQLRLLNSSADI